jgi:hypothetical protein
MDAFHLSRADLDAALPSLLQSPKDMGTLEMIVRRPAENEREVLEAGRLDVVAGVVGDTWRIRSSSRTADGSAHPDMQLNIMNARVIALLARSRERWALAGDQLYVDLDISEANLPPGTRLRIGEALVVVTDQPHLGCKKFVARFGMDAMQFVNDVENRKLRLRGMCAKVVEAGEIRRGDVVERV